ncbi:MAG: ribonuclease HII, partial [Armatimonadota bacterium]|nr:ribonuclease HII [Armatimonadota bacterium]
MQQRRQPLLRVRPGAERGGQGPPHLLAAAARGAGALDAPPQAHLRLQRERQRLEDLLALERAWRAQGYTHIAGVDEAGVGPLAGPVVAAAVMLPEEAALPGLDDSKALSPRERGRLFEAILASGARVGIGLATPAEIDRLNVLQATRLAWRRAVTQLSPRPDLLLVDGRYRVDLDLAQVAIVGGDARCAVIAAASIVAKVTRDRVMCDLDARYPQFGFARHKGYATPAHLAALRRYGCSPAHRRSFLPLRFWQQALFD